MSESDSATIRAYIVNTDDMVDMFADIDRLKDGNFAGKWHSFPTTTVELQATLKEIGMDGVKHKAYTLNDFDGIPEALRDAISMFTDLNELNYLALNLSGLTDSQREVFEAVLESGRHCESVADVINLMGNLDRFDLQPAYTPEMYGAFLLETEKDNTLEVFDRLEKSSNSDERAFAQYVLRLEAHIDETDYGRGIAQEENGAFTKHGYLTESEDFKEVYRGPEDVPAEYRVFAYPDPEPFMKVENADLNALLLKMHALGGDYMADAHYNLNTLANKRSAEYLLLMTGRGIFLTEAAHVYRRGTTAFDAFMNTAEGPDTRAFAIHVTDMHDPRGVVIGDLVELDLTERQLDILKHSIQFTHVDATPKYGPDQTFTPEQWEAMEDIDRHMLQSWTRHFDSGEQQAVLRHLEDIRGEHAETGKVVEEGVLLSDINKSYMDKSENAQPGMLRIPLPAAKDMLAHGDAPVYRLFPDSPKELSPLDAMPSRGGLWYSSYREFAIKKDDLAGIGKWADRTADAMIVKRQPERDAPDKANTRGPEL